MNIMDMDIEWVIFFCYCDGILRNQQSIVDILLHNAYTDTFYVEQSDWNLIQTLNTYLALIFYIHAVWEVGGYYVIPREVYIYCVAL